jgi:hypothetical protein
MTSEIRLSSAGVDSQFRVLTERSDVKGAAFSSRPISRNQGTLSHPLTWIVLRVDVFKAPRAHGVDLKHGLSVGIDKMVHTRG